MVSMKDIAKRCSVSTATVSKALNGQPDIGEETRERILRLADEMGYMANSAARALKTNRSYNIGVLFVDPMHGGLAHEFFSTVLDGIRSEAERHGYDITFINGSVGQRQTSYLQHCRYRGVDGVVIASADFQDPAIVRLAESEIPTVTLDYSFDSRTSILSDNVRGMETLVRFVHSRGHRRIAFVHGEVTSVTQKRLASFKKTCAALGLEIPPDYIRPAIYHDPRSSGLHTRALLALPNRPTCIIYPDDLSFLGGMSELERHGLSIPKDMSVAGYDGIPLSQVLRPRLTTYRQGAERMGREAARLLIEQIENPDTWLPRQITAEGQLLEGSTVSDIG